MDAATLATGLQQQNGSKILLVISDGLGGIGGERGTELEAADTPHLDQLAAEGSTGLLTPVAPGITCGSGPGHFALFGYDPIEHNPGRGVLTALGVNFDLRPGDVAARGNFCTLDKHGRVTDRRAGRIPTGKNEALIQKLRQVRLEGVELYLETVKEHRFLLVLRGEGLGAELRDTDPQQTGVPPLPPRPENDKSRRTADLVAAFIDQVRGLIGDEEPANMVLLRGFESLPKIPSLRERFGLRACALAGYPMYRGIARLLGMKTVDCGPGLDSEVEALRSVWREHDFFFLHYKATDSAGEDGDFEAKRRAIEELDRHIPGMLAMQPDVVAVTGDHSTPSQLASHSWHPVPVLLHAATARRDPVQTFGETACLGGALGQIPTKDLMPLMLAHAGRLRKYGA